MPSLRRVDTPFQDLPTRCYPLCGMVLLTGRRRDKLLEHSNKGQGGRLRLRPSWHSAALLALPPSWAGGLPRGQYSRVYIVTWLPSDLQSNSASRTYSTAQPHGFECGIKRERLTSCRCAKALAQLIGQPCWMVLPSPARCAEATQDPCLIPVIAPQLWGATFEYASSPTSGVT